MNEVVYRIAKWDEVFERSDTRKVQRMNWVALPINFSSHGYQCLLDEFGDESPSIYGAWCALVLIAASCTVRGTLCNSRGRPLPLTHLVRLSGFPPDVFRKLMEWASRNDVQWLEVVDQEELLKLITDNGVPTAEGGCPAVENTDFPAEKRSSRKPPDDFPKHPDVSGNHPDYRTGQDRTLHNTTGQDKTGGSSSVGRSSGEIVLSEMTTERLLAVDKSAVEKACQQIVKSLPFQIENEKLGRMVRVGIASGVRSQMLETCKVVGSPSINRPRAYWDKSVQKMVEEAGFDYVKAIETLERLASASKKTSLDAASVAKTCQN